MVSAGMQEREQEKTKQKVEDTKISDVTKQTEEKKDPNILTLEDVKQQVHLIEKSVQLKDSRFASRVLRALPSTRKKLNSEVLIALINGYYTSASNDKTKLLDYLGQSMDTDSKPLTFHPRSAKASTQPLLPEVSTYICLLLLIHLIDSKMYDKAVMWSKQVVEKLSTWNRRTLDGLQAKCFFYYARAHELVGQLETIRSFLHSRLRTCALHSDMEGQACLLNLLLRNYLMFDLFDQADKLVSKSAFPEQANNNEWARYLYYLGRIKAIQLDYSDAHKNLLQAIRKAPQHGAPGFRQTVQKLAVTVELLLGDIPERALFREPIYKRALAPYFQLTQAVRTGNLGKFTDTLGKYGEKFRADNTYTLIVRLRHNVIKTGVRMINLSYARISLSDIALKLQLDSPEDAEYIIAKAIRDNVIDATINHEKGYVQSKENPDVYSTTEPMTAFHQRISFCLDIHNHSVKAMRFPPKSYNKDLESADERREREQLELESAKEIADEDFDGF
ncbi:26S proteasome non-ATPase regulatory subunit 3-like [Watersipora subatra]|uniref:26S proteasome non-ATPase regulatory subunit 3-like n=1 Tax=Watersipora subatra TaxID=2589382 RepID=UPI00355C1263